MEAGRIINQGQAAGEPQMGQVYSGSYPAFAANSLQVVSLDKTGAQMSNGEGRKPTYSAALIAYTPYASPQDIVGLAGSASKQVRVLRFAVSGRATSANQLDVQLVKRSAADTGGTLIFTGLDASLIGLWVSDGTAGGTHELTGIPGVDPTFFVPGGFTVLNVFVEWSEE